VLCPTRSPQFIIFPFLPDDAADQSSTDCLAALESIDDDLDEKNILAVKMSDTTEAKNYGVKSFPSIIVFVKKIPELYEGDVKDEAAVLGWALTQAGVKIPAPRESLEDPFSFPGAEAGKGAPATPKVTPKPVAKEAVPEEAEEEADDEEEEAGDDSDATTGDEEPELSETVDKIKNDNNVVVFFCKYSILYQIHRYKNSLYYTTTVVLHLTLHN